MKHEVYMNFRKECAKCGEINYKRNLNKIYYAPSHFSVTNPRMICHICDNCLASLADYLEVNIDTEKYKDDEYRLT